MNGGSAADTGGTAGSGGETKGCAAVVVDLEATGGRRQGRHYYFCGKEISAAPSQNKRGCQANARVDRSKNKSALYLEQNLPETALVR